ARRGTELAPRGRRQASRGRHPRPRPARCAGRSAARGRRTPRSGRPSPRKVARSATVCRMLIALLVCSPLLVQAKPGLEAIAPGAIAAHVRFLADDLLEGRGTGERGHAVAERYVVSQMQILGLRPAGEAGTFLQEVLLR